MTRKKKFGQTTVGKLLGGALSLINPVLGQVVTGKQEPQEIIKAITSADVPAEDKIRAKELVLETYEAEIADRVSARDREAKIAAAGGSDIMFKAVGTGVLVIWAGLIYALFIGELNVSEDTSDLMNIAFGAVSSQVMSIVSYYFGSAAKIK